VHSIGYSSVADTVRRPAPPMGRNLVFRKSQLGWVNMSVYNFLVSGPKFTKVFSPNRG